MRRRERGVLLCDFFLTALGVLEDSERNFLKKVFWLVSLLVRCRSIYARLFLEMFYESFLTNTTQGKLQQHMLKADFWSENNSSIKFYLFIALDQISCT